MAAPGQLDEDEKEEEKVIFVAYARGRDREEAVGAV
jgi:hypothetical protein